MKRICVYVGLLTVVILVASALSCSAQEKGHFQGGVKGSAIPGIYWDPHYTADLSLGWRFNEKRYLGVGTGCHWIKPFARAPHGEIVDVDFIPTIPLFADYLRYFPFSKHPKNAFYLGLEGGVAWYLEALPAETRHPSDKMFPYLNGKAGFDFSLYKNLGVNIGINLVSGVGHGLGLKGEGGHGAALIVGIRF